MKKILPFILCSFLLNKNYGQSFVNSSLEFWSTSTVNCYLDPRFENKELAKKYLGKAENDFVKENPSQISVIGKWKILECQFKIPGWHTDPVGDLYQFKSDQYLTITPADSLSHITTYKYTVNEKTITLIIENEREVEYLFNFLSKNRLKLENDLIKLVLKIIKE